MSIYPCDEIDDLTRSLVLRRKPTDRVSRIASIALKLSCIPIGIISFSPPVRRLAISNGTLLLGENFLGYLVGYLFMFCAWFTWGLTLGFSWMDMVYEPRLKEEIVIEDKKEPNLLTKTSLFIGALGSALVMQLGMFYLVTLSQEQGGEEGYFWPVVVTILYAGISCNSLYGTFKNVYEKIREGSLNCQDSTSGRKRFIYHINRSVQISLERMRGMSTTCQANTFPTLFSYEHDDLESSTDSDFEDISDATEKLLYEVMHFAVGQGLIREKIVDELNYLNFAEKASLARWIFTPGRYLWEFRLVSQAIKTIPGMPSLAANAGGLLSALAFIHFTDRAAKNRLVETKVFLENLRYESLKKLVFRYQWVTSCIAILGLNTTTRFLIEEYKGDPVGVYVLPAELLTAGLFVNFSVSHLAQQSIGLLSRAYTCAKERISGLSEKEIAQKEQREIDHRLSRYVQLLNKLDDQQLEILRERVLNVFSQRGQDAVGLDEFTIRPSEEPGCCFDVALCQETSNSFARHWSVF